MKLTNLHKIQIETMENQLLVMLNVFYKLN
jgi:hypothetical protein